MRTTGMSTKMLLIPSEYMKQKTVLVIELSPTYHIHVSSQSPNPKNLIHPPVLLFFYISFYPLPPGQSIQSTVESSGYMHKVKCKEQYGCNIRKVDTRSGGYIVTIPAIASISPRPYAPIYLSS